MKWINKLHPEEKELITLYGNVLGVDEVNRFSFMCPVTIAGVLLTKDQVDEIIPVADSKLLTEKQILEIGRELMQRYIFTVRFVPVTSCSDGKYSKAFYSSVRSMIKELQPKVLLVDYYAIPSVHILQKGCKDGDKKYWTIAAASIVAKLIYNSAFDASISLKYPAFRNTGRGSHYLNVLKAIENSDKLPRKQLRLTTIKRLIDKLEKKGMKFDKAKEKLCL